MLKAYAAFQKLKQPIDESNWLNKKFNSPIHTIDVDGGIFPADLLYSDGGGFPCRQNTLTRIAGYSLQH